MILLIWICAGLVCDRVVQPVDNCVMAGLQAQIILSRTELQHGAAIRTWCGTPKEIESRGG
jgi:hypothetical protein